MKFTLKGLVILMIVVCITAVLLVPAFYRADRNRRFTSCTSHLSQLWKMQWNYAVHFGGFQKLMPVQTGSEFWLELTRTDPPLIDQTLRDVFQCPVRGWSPGLPCAFRGPNGNLNNNQFADGDPVGADRIDNHGNGEGGNVLRKSGDVITVSATDELWAAAARKTIP